jgi:CBS domain containing-hemolysin-like protein
MIGIITLEDIIKELVQNNEEDEDDFVQLKGE